MAGLLIKTTLTARRSSVGDLYTSYCSEIDHVATLFVNPTVISQQPAIAGILASG